MSKESKRRPPKVKQFSELEANDFLNILSESDSIPDVYVQFAKSLVDGNAWINEELERGTLTIARLRKLFKIQGSEKASNRKRNSQSKSKGSKSNFPPKGHGRNGADAYHGADIVDVVHPEYSPGDICPELECGGRLYEMTDPGVVVRVSGAPLASATRYQLQKLRCAICEVIYTATLPEGVSSKKYDEGFVAMLMINKYFMSVPLYRQDRLQKYLGMPLPSSTQWDLMVAHEPMLKALHEALLADAANGLALCYDDTSVKILTEIQAKKAAQQGEKSKHTCFNTGIVSLHQDHHTYIYMADNNTAGQFMGEVLELRDPDLDLPVVMCDALSSNIPQQISEDLYILCYCLVHARRKFYELPDGYDDLADEVIRMIGHIYDNEKDARKMEPDKRLSYHKKHSKPIMDKLKSYLEEQSNVFEPNGVAGKAINYMLKRWTNLSGFLQHANAPIDNNITERALKLVIQTRKSSMFYKSLKSAAFASFVQSALYTAAQNNINPCKYMQDLLENESSVMADPAAWLPWIYQSTLKQTRAKSAKLG